MEPGSLKSRCRQGHAPSPASRGGDHPSFLPASGGLMSFFVCGNLIATPASMFTWLWSLSMSLCPDFPGLTRTQATGLGLTPVSSSPLGYIRQYPIFEGGHIHKCGRLYIFLWGCSSALNKGLLLRSVSVVSEGRWALVPQHALERCALVVQGKFQCALHFSTTEDSLPR